jgi:hypothetical protein
VSDDVCASFSPQMFREFSMPYNSRIYAEFGSGRLHNCGPHPSAALYPLHTPACLGLNCSFRYTRSEFPALREAFRGKGLVEVNFDNNESPEEVLAGYQEASEALLPDVPAIPLIIINETHRDEEVRDLFRGLRKIAERCAAEVRWNEN